MRILLASSHAIGAWFLLRLMKEGHDCSWFLLTDEPNEDMVLKGLIPPPLKSKPDLSAYQLVIFDSTGHPEEAEECRKVTAVIGDGELPSKLEDDRLYGMQCMEKAGIEVPRYEVFSSPEEAAQWIEENPGRYVYKPFEPENGKEQTKDITYVSESADDLIKCLPELFEKSFGASFLLQEVVSGTEVSTEAYFDGRKFWLHNHTLECKKFMSGDHGPNTGCSGNLVWATQPNRLFAEGLGKLEGYLGSKNYRGMVDLNTIVNEQHCYGLEFTPRFGYDASATLFSLLDGNLGEFFYEIASGPCEEDPTPKLRAKWGASARYSIPPYPSEILGFHPEGIPVTGICVEDAWLNFYLYDVREESDALVTAGVSGMVGSSLASGHSPDGAWSGVERIAKSFKVPNMQVRNDLHECTLERLNRLREMNWIND